MHVFVYGTLRRGGPWHGDFIERSGAKLIKEATLSGFSLYDIRGIPGIKLGEGTVVGEVYDFPQEFVEGPLDRLECNYDRIVVTLDDGTAAHAYEIKTLYRCAVVVESGDWLKYTLALTCPVCRYRKEPDEEVCHYCQDEEDTDHYTGVEAESEIEHYDSL